MNYDVSDAGSASVFRLGKHLLWWITSAQPSGYKCIQDVHPASTFLA